MGDRPIKARLPKIAAVLAKCEKHRHLTGDGGGFLREISEEPKLLGLSHLPVGGQPIKARLPKIAAVLAKCKTHRHLTGDGGGFCGKSQKNRSCSA
ncbi:MAG: hypothetical protein Q4E13_11480 [Clostridia bacterium]|nr:hypothetical protein [Clostridia bacterium]